MLRSASEGVDAIEITPASGSLMEALEDPKDGSCCSLVLNYSTEIATEFLANFLRSISQSRNDGGPACSFV